MLPGAVNTPRRARIGASLLAAALQLAPTAALAQSPGERTDHDASRHYVSSAVYLTLTVPLLVNTPDDGRVFAGSLDRRIRESFAVTGPGTAPDVVSYIPFVALPALSLLGVGALQGDGLSAEETGMAAESLAAVWLLTEIVKDVVRRERPNNGASGDRFASFFSGHTSIAFAGATNLALDLRSSALSDGARAGVTTLLFAAAATTGLLRVRARRHWTTDVLVGAAAGTGLVLAMRAGYHEMR